MTLVLTEGFNDARPLVDVPPPQNEAEWLVLGDRTMRDLADCRGEMNANAAAKAIELARVQNAYADLQGALQRREASLLALLEQVAQAVPMRGKKSRNLAFGTIGYRATKDKLEVLDEDKVRAWVLANCTQGDKLKILEPVTTEKLRKKELDAYAFANGEIPDGTTVIASHEEFYAHPSEPHV